LIRFRTFLGAAVGIKSGFCINRVQVSSIWNFLEGTISGMTVEEKKRFFSDSTGGVGSVSVTGVTRIVGREAAVSVSVVGSGSSTAGVSIISGMGSVCGSVPGSAWGCSLFLGAKEKTPRSDLGPERVDERVPKSTDWGRRIPTPVGGAGRGTLCIGTSGILGGIME